MPPRAWLIRGRRRWESNHCVCCSYSILSAFAFPRSTLQTEIKMNVVHVSWSFYNHSHNIGNVRQEEHCILFSSFQPASGRPSQGRLWFLFSLFQHIRSILDVIYPPSSGVTKCYLTNYRLPSSPSLFTPGRQRMCLMVCVCVGWGEWEPHRQIESESESF